MPSEPSVANPRKTAGDQRAFFLNYENLLKAYRTRSTMFSLILFCTFTLLYFLCALVLPEPSKTAATNLIASLFAAILVWLLVDKTLTTVHLNDIENRFLGALHNPSIIPELFTIDKKQAIAGSALSALVGNESLGHTAVNSLRHSCSRPHQDICYNLNWHIGLELDPQDNDYFYVNGRIDYKRNVSDEILRFRCVKAPQWRQEREILSRKSEFTWVFLGKTESSSVADAMFSVDFINAGGKVFSNESDSKIERLNDDANSNEIIYQTGRFKPRNDNDGLSIVSFSFRVRQARRYGSMAVILARYTRDATFTVNMGTMPVDGVHFYCHLPAENYPTPLSQTMDHRIIEIKLAGWALKGGGVVYSWQELKS